MYGWLDVDVTRALAYLEATSSTAPASSPSRIWPAAVALAIADCPSVNAIIRRGRLQLRDHIDVFFQVATSTREPVGARSSTWIAAPDHHRARARRAGGEHPRARNHASRSDARLSRVRPRCARWPCGPSTCGYDWGWDLRRFGVPNDAFGCAMVTNVGVSGPHALAPLVPFSRVPIVVTLGASATRRSRNGKS